MTESAPEPVSIGGPFETETEASKAITAITRDDYTPAAKFAVLTAVAADAGIKMGAWDWRIMNWLAMYEPATVAVIAGWIERAALGLEARQ